jgi:hypothetical protein
MYLDDVTVTNPTAALTLSSTVRVADSDVLTGSASNIARTEGQSFSGTLATFTDSYTHTTAANLNATINWGDGTSSTGTVTGSNGSFTVAGSHTYLDEGTFTTTVTLRESAPGTAVGIAHSTATIAEADALSVTSTNPVAATEGLTFSGVLATFADSYTIQTASGLSATITWGDGTSSTGTVAGSGGAFTVSGTHKYADEGTFTVTVTLRDKSPSTVTATATTSATVAEADALSVTGANAVTTTEGQTFSGALATFADTFTGQTTGGLSTTINWGDGTSSGGTIAGGNGMFTVSGSHKYTDEGTFTVTVTLRDRVPSTVSATATTTASVTEGDVLTGSGKTIAATEAAAFSGAVATFADTDTSTPAGGFTATISWGDGTSSAGTITGSAGSFTVSGSHTYAEEGTYTLHVTLTDKAPGTATATVTGTANVAEAPLSGTITAAPAEGNFSGQVATFTDPDHHDTVSDYSAVIHWGDGTTSAGTIAATSTPGLFAVNGSHSYTDEGTFTISVTINHPVILVPNGGFETGTFSSWTVGGNNPTPVVSTVAAHSGTHSALLGTTGTFGTEPTGDSWIKQTIVVPTGSSTLSFWYKPSTTDSITFDWQEAQIQNTSGNLLAQVFKVCENDQVWKQVTFDLSPYAGRTVVLYFNVHQDGYGDLTSMYLDDVALSRPALSLSKAVSVREGDVLTGHAVTIASPIVGLPFTGTVATFTNTLASSPSGDFSAVINWGDGTATSAGTVSGGGGTFSVSGSHTYATTGSFTVTVTLTDDAPGTATAAATSTATVSPHTEPANVLVNNRAEDTQFPGQNTQSETTLLLGANNSVIVGFNDSGQYDSSANGHFTGYSVSGNGGTTFTDKGTLPASTDGDVGDPVLARDTVTGRIYYATLDLASADGTASPGIYVFRSDDNGNTFQTPVKAGAGFETDPSSFYDKDWITVDNAPATGQGTVYLVFRDFGVNFNGIFLTRSTDHGSTWSTPIEIADAGSGNVQGAYVVTGPDHAVYVSWLDETGTQDAIKVRQSTDLGVTFAAPVTVAMQNTPGAGNNGDLGLTDSNGNYFRSNTFPQAVVNSVTGAIYVVYDDKGLLANDKADVFFTQSTNGGQTWSAPIRVNDDATSNDQWQPAIAVTPDGTHVGIFWYDRRLDPADNLIDRYGVVGTVGSNGAITFGGNFRISDASFPPVFGNDPVVNPSYMGDYDQAVADNSNFYLSWGDNRLGDADVRFAKVPVAGLGTSGNGSSALQQASAAWSQSVAQLLAAFFPATKGSIYAAEAFLADSLQSGWTPADSTYLTGLLTDSNAPGSGKTGNPPKDTGDDGEHEGHDFADPGWMTDLGGGKTKS